jgi:putative ABC transport system permease protein
MMFQDLRYGAWMLLKNPGFTIVAILSLALAIGANTAMFSYVDAVLLKPLAYKDPDRLVMVWELYSDGGKAPPSSVAFSEWRAQAKAFSHLSAITSSGATLNLTGPDRTERIRGSFVSANYFEMLGIQPMLGRCFSAEEERPGNERVVVLTNRFWQQRFGASPNILGSTILLNNESYTVIGMLPGGGIFDRETADVWLPLAFKLEQLRPDVRFFSVMGRLNHGSTIEQANAEVKLIVEKMSQQSQSNKKAFSAFVEPLRNHIVGSQTRATLFLLMGAAAFILLIACANIANLLLARSAVRQREVIIRMALGASQLRLMRQFLTESVLLAVISGGFGVILAIWLVKGLAALMPRLTIPTEVEVALDWRILLFTLGVSFLTGIIFGLAPALAATRLDLTKPLQERNVGSSARLSRNKPRSLLLISEIALCFALLIGAALMIRSFQRLLQVELGFETKNILTLRASLDRGRYPQAHQIVAYQSELLNRIRALPGVTSGAVTNALPLGGTSVKGVIHILSKGSIASKDPAPAALRVVSHDYLATMGIRLLKGRHLSEQDAMQSPPVVVINQSLAMRFEPGDDPVGSQIQIAGDSFAQISFTIVGVVNDIRHMRLEGQSEPEIYIPLGQAPDKAISSYGRSLFFVIRTAVNPTTLTATIQTLAASVDKNQPIYGVRTMEQVYSESITQPRFLTTLFSLFGVLALALAVVGIYGVMAYSVTQRTQEIGIRMALGAQTRDVLRLVIGQAMVITCAGLGIGLALALALSRYLSGLLYEVTPTDVATYSGAALLLAGVTLLASYLPARAAIKVDPVLTLRYD